MWQLVEDIGMSHLGKRANQEVLVLEVLHAFRINLEYLGTMPKGDHTPPGLNQHNFVVF